jgi:hypothetical protein
MLIEAPAKTAPERHDSPLVAGLQQARDLIADPKRWTTGTTARDVDGVPIHSRKPQAVSWCAIGAIQRVVPEHLSFYAIQALVDACGVEVSLVNDRYGHEAILTLFDNAIAMRRESC